MNKTEIIVHGEKLDLYPNTEVGVTYQRNDFNEIKTRQFTFTKDFNVPASPRNIRLLGHANRQTSGSGVQYRYTDVAILSEGTQITDDAIMEVVRAGRGFDLCIMERNVSFWQAIEGQKLIDNYDPFAMVAITHSRTPQKALEFNTKTTDPIRIVYPIAYFGAGFGRDTLNRVVLDVRYQQPALMVKDMIVTTIERAGYTLESYLLDDPMFNELALLYAGDAKAGEGLNVKVLFPDISKKDFIKSMGFLMGVDFVQDPTRPQVIITKEFDYPIYNAEPVDWSGKINWKKKRDYEFAWGEWMRNNIFTYDNDEYVGDVGRGVLPYKNETLGESYEAFKVPFSAGLNLPNSNSGGVDGFLTIPQVREIDEEGEVTDRENYKHIVCLIKRGNVPVSYTNKTTTTGVFQNTQVPYAHFDDRLKLDNLVNERYILLRSMFERPFKLTCYMDLSPQDISELNLERLIYINDSYRDEHINGNFIVSKVNNYVPGTFTEVELIEVGASVLATSDVENPIEEKGFLIDNEGNYAVDPEGNKIFENKPGQFNG